MGLIIIVIGITIIIKKYKSYKEWKEAEEKMLRSVEENKKVKNFYELIKSDYRIIERICLICLNDSTNADNEILFFNDTNNNVDIIHYIDFEKFKNFFGLYKAKKFPHFYHDEY